MKKWLLLGILILLSGCSSQESGKQMIKERETPAADPSVEVESAQAFAEAGVEIEVPAGAENARYYIISGRIAEIQFGQNGVQYSYRASQMTENITGVQGELQALEGVQAVAGSSVIPIQTAGSAYLAVWKWGNVTYSLMTEGPVDPGIMKALTEELARESMPVQV